jgi:hypothetical protein
LQNFLLEDAKFPVFRQDLGKCRGSIVTEGRTSVTQPEPPSPRCI